MAPRKKGYKIPSMKTVKKALHNVLKENPAVSSQEKMLFLILKELHEKNPQYTISGQRLRYIAMKTNFASIETRCRETAERRGLLTCPVCQSKTKVIKNQTIYGGSVALEHQCPTCGYWSGIHYRKPVRYRFLLQEGK